VAPPGAAAGTRARGHRFAGHGGLGRLVRFARTDVAPVPLFGPPVALPLVALRLVTRAPVARRGRVAAGRRRLLHRRDGGVVVLAARRGHRQGLVDALAEARVAVLVVRGRSVRRAGDFARLGFRGPLTGLGFAGLRLVARRRRGLARELVRVAPRPPGRLDLLVPDRRDRQVVAVGGRRLRHRAGRRGLVDLVLVVVRQRLLHGLGPVVDVDARAAFDDVVEHEVGSAVGGQHVADVQEPVDAPAEGDERGADARLDVDDLALVDVA